MKTKDYACNILNNAGLIRDTHNRELAIEVAKEAYEGGLLPKDRLSLLIQANEHVSKLLREKNKEDERKAKLSPEARVFEKYSHNEWDEESGPYAAMTFSSFEKAVKEYTNELRQRISELEEKYEINDN